MSFAGCFCSGWEFCDADPGVVLMISLDAGDSLGL